MNAFGNFIAAAISYYQRGQTMSTIEELLHRRTDLSTFLVHLTRSSDQASAKENLLSIARNSAISARTPFGPAAYLETHLAETGASQKAVCFTETPLEHTWMMLQDIEGRSVKFEPYGLVISKTTARKNHFNPVWYSDISVRGGRSWPMTYVNQMIDHAKRRATNSQGRLSIEQLQTEPIFQVTPFFEQMGPMSNGGRKEFWWEREWRHIGDYFISDPSQIVAILAPETDHKNFQMDLAAANSNWARMNRPLLDPLWGLERMLAHLAGLASKDIGPFPDAS